MNYESELRLLTTGFSKCRLKTAIIPLSKRTEPLRGGELERLMSGMPPHSMNLDSIRNKTLYKLTDGFGLKYRYFLLDSGRVLSVGPYLDKRLTETELLEIGEKNAIAPKEQKYLREFCEAIPVLGSADALFMLLDAFLEHLWECDSFAIVDCTEPSEHTASPINSNLGEDSFDDLLVSMKAMEQRYSYENELMEAVSLGQLHKEEQLLSAISVSAFEKRVADPMRNAKNYGIIMNTLLRKAAERGGVHPVYLDKISSDFATKIEQSSDTSENTALMLDMFRAYCRLVRKHSMRSYSPLIQKTILIIDSDLAADLSLSALASAQGVSGGYLATVFKRETGKTLTEYVRERRVSHAEHLLSSTNLQIQTVALHCGILDLQYFSKLFKRETGKTPKEYRESAKKAGSQRLSGV